MGFLDAAVAVLREVGEPLHYDEITKRAIDRGLIATEGKTPGRTMNAVISTSLASGSSLLARSGRGIYGLAEWTHEPAEPVPLARSQTRPPMARARTLPATCQLAVADGLGHLQWTEYSGHHLGLPDGG